MKRLFLALAAAVLTFTGAQAQKTNVHVPDGGRYKILLCDFHIHSVFSDGDLWPTLRVEEAVNEGLDAISLTEHIEHRPKLEEFVTRDHNRSSQIARPVAERSDLIFVNGTEVTRGMPPGHLNAIFISDANVLDAFVDPNDDRNGANIKETLREIKKQGAFVFWNHPNFPGNQPAAILHPIHKEMIAEGLIDGIEVVNGDKYEPDALRWCLENNLAVMGTSDAHSTVQLEMDRMGLSHRSVTLVLANERSAQAIREALDARRTVAIMGDNLYGRSEHVKEVFEASLDIRPMVVSESSAIIRLRNNSSIPYMLEVTDSGEARTGRGREITVGAYSDARITLSPARRGESLPATGRTVTVKVNNVYVDADQRMTYNFDY